MKATAFFGTKKRVKKLTIVESKENTFTFEGTQIQKIYLTQKSPIKLNMIHVS